MKLNRSSLSARMKRYEESSALKLTRRTPVILRLDGKAFHTFTRGLKKPFDLVLMQTMQKTMRYLCQNIQGCALGYTQSDEITLVLIDYQTLTSDAWFDYRVDKMCSIAAAMATLMFNNFFNESTEEYYRYNIVNGSVENITEDIVYLNLLKSKCYTGMFDCRAFNVPKEDVCNNILWRQQDAERNSILGLAQSLFSHKAISGISCAALQDKMFSEKGINWSELEAFKKRGSACRYSEDEGWVVDLNMPILKGVDRAYVNDTILYTEVLEEI